MGTKQPSPGKHKITPGWAIAVTAVLLWVSVIIAAYFWAHKPFNLDQVLSLLHTLSSIVVWLGLLWLAAAVGRRACGQLLGDESPALRLVLTAGLGLGLLSLLVLVLGLLGWLQALVAWAVVLVLGISLRRQLKASWADLGQIQIPRPHGRFQHWLAVFFILSLLMAFLLALAPPTGWDSLVYHLTGPRLFIQAGKIVHTIDLPYLGFPQLGEMLFTLGMLLSGDGVPALIHFGYGVMAVVVTAALAGRLFGRNAGWLAAALLLSAPSLLNLMSRAYVDLMLLFYLTAAVTVFLRWRDDRRAGWLWLMGALAGFCTGVKYTAVIVPLALVLVVMWTSRRDGLRGIVSQALQLAAATLLVSLPWLLENWLTTGNPLYPFFLSGNYWDSWRAWWYDRPGTGFLSSAPWRLLTAPLEATVLGSEGLAAYDATIGPLLLACLPLLLVAWSSLGRVQRQCTGYLLFFLGLNYALWLIGLARSALLLQTRLLLPVFGLVAVLGAVGLDRLQLLRRPQLAVDWLVRALVALSLALLLFAQLTTLLQVNPLPVILGIESRDRFLERRLGMYHTVVQDLNRLPDETRVVFLWEPRSYACQVDCQPDALLDRFLHLSYLYPDAESITRHWQEAGVTHILLYQHGMQAIVDGGFDPVTPHDLAVMEDLRTNHLLPTQQWGDSYILYQLDSGR